MKKFYLMPAMTMVIAAAVSTRMQAAAASGSDANPRRRSHIGAGNLARRVRRTINDWVAGAIARRERRVTRFALRNLSDIELKDFGAYRGNPGSALRRDRDLKSTTRR
jgi:uncharacterized protein YjiS (DUF1127 family)